jgi:hypothetical protein
MQARQLERLIVENSVRTSADMDIRMRVLREAGKIRTAGRGRNAPHVDPTAAAWIVIGASASPVASDAAKAAEEHFRLSAARDQFRGAATFGEAMAMILGDPTLQAAGSVSLITLKRFSNPDANSVLKAQIAGQIEWRDEDGVDRSSLYLPQPVATKLLAYGQDIENFGASQIFTTTNVGGGLLYEIAACLHELETEGGGWVADRPKAGA